MRLAHFSDIHVTHAPFASGPGLRGKRWAGTANYYVGGRGRHFEGAEARIEALLADVDAMAPDHALCTGDLTQMAWPSELARAAELFGERLDHPERWTVIPGNHDRYTPEADRDRWFERYLGAAAPKSYPFVKALDGGRVQLVLLDVTRATGMIDSSGLCGEEQLGALEGLLTQPPMRSAFVVLALHYGLRRSDGAPDRPRHGIEDAEALEQLLAREDVPVDLVLHGHMHRPYAVATAGPPSICVGSGTDLAHGGGWHLLELDPAARTIRLRRRVWSPAAAAYVDAPEPIPGQAWLERLPG